MAEPVKPLHSENLTQQDELVIQLNDLVKEYDGHKAVDRLTLSIRRGEIFGLLGPNGAGKTTTILMMLGLTEPTSGTVRVCGLNATYEPIRVKRKVGYLPDEVGFYEDMTALENVLYTAALNGIAPDEALRRARYLLEQVGLEEQAGNKVRSFSHGMKRRLGLADVLIKQPEVIILDEPTNGIDPEGVRDLLALIRRLSRQEGVTVLLSSHHLHQVQQICDRVGIFVAGRLIAVGDIAALAGQLFADEPLLFHVEAEPLDDALLARLKALPSVVRIEQNGPRLSLYCREDAAPDIAAAVVAGGARLHALSRQDYGLDEIYHRYFQGEGGRNDGADGTVH